MLESRHLVGLFVLMVVIFGVVFLLGYELGRNQYGEQVRAAAMPADDGDAPPTAVTASASKTLPAASKTGSASATVPATAPPPSDYDFYKLGQPNQPPARLTSPPKSTAKSSVKSNATPAAPGKTGKPVATIAAKTVSTNPPVAPRKPTSAVKSSAPALNAPLIPKGSIVLQVSALSKESDALALAQALQQKKFPAFVMMPGADRYYHVQVGPYADGKTADAARKALQDAGFKPIVKR